jgi:cell division transport system permease protein
VPPTGFTATLTLFTAGAMAFLAVFALALSLAAGGSRSAGGRSWRRASRCGSTARRRGGRGAGAGGAAHPGQTPGVAEARALSDEENRALLEPWLGPDVPVEALPDPAARGRGDAEEASTPRGCARGSRPSCPGAVLDDHALWRAPLVSAAGWLRALGWLALLLIAGSTAAMITLARRRRWRPTRR